MSSQSQHNDKVVIVTGGASGIGKEICNYLAKRGSSVVVADLNFSSAEEVVSTIISTGGKAIASKVDVGKQTEVESLITETYKRFGRIDVLFNNAGIGLNGEFQDTNLEQWNWIMAVNFWGTIYGCHAVYPIMMKQGFGQIINVSSLAGLMPAGLLTSYTAAKHAVVGFSLSLRAEARQYGIKVNALCPGFIETPIHDASPNVSAYLNSEKNKRNKNKFPRPEDCIGSMMRGVHRDKAIIISPRKHKVYWWLYRLAPALVPHIWSRIIRYLKK
jgi:NAD(P)-dependent dehydrogenase (short-subunit alcohol dehydrogenase family)